LAEIPRRQELAARPSLAVLFAGDARKDKNNRNQRIAEAYRLHG